MSNPILEYGISTLTFTRGALERLYSDFPKDKLCHQPFPGANHALWTMGHLATADEYFLQKVGNRPTTRFDELQGIFFMKSIPSAHAKDYPAFEEVQAYFRDARERLIAYFRSLTPEQLAEPLDPQMKQFAADRGILMRSIAWHEGFHTGQLAVVRKALNIPTAFG